jgi:hypothetical protein
MTAQDISVDDQGVSVRSPYRTNWKAAAKELVAPAFWSSVTGIQATGLWAVTHGGSFFSSEGSAGVVAFATTATLCGLALTAYYGVKTCRNISKILAPTP